MKTEWLSDRLAPRFASCVVAAAVWTCLSSGVAAQDGTQPDPGTAPAAAPAGEPAGDADPQQVARERAVEVFEDHIVAMGGRDAVFGVTKRVITGTYEGAPLKFPGRLRMVNEAPDRMLWEISEPAGMSIKTVYNGEQAWREMQTGLGEPAIDWILGPPLLNLIESASFYGEADYENRYREIRYVGSAEFYGTVCHVVRGVRNSGKMMLLFFDTSTDLYKGCRTAVLDGGEVRQLDVRIGRWQEVDGVLVPETMIQQFRGENVSMVFTMPRARHVEDTGVDWSPPASLGEWPELNEFYMPVQPGADAEAGDASEPADAP